MSARLIFVGVASGRELAASGRSYSKHRSHTPQPMAEVCV